MKTSFFVLWLSIICIVMLLTVLTTTTHATSQEQTEVKPTNDIKSFESFATEAKKKSNSDTCACVDCYIKLLSSTRQVVKEISCDDGIPAISIINMQTSGGTTFSYYILTSSDDHDKFIAFDNFKYDTVKSRPNYMNCSLDTTNSRFESQDNKIYIGIHATGSGSNILRYYIQHTCVPRHANDYSVVLSEPNPKYYFGSRIRVEIIFSNYEDASVDTFLHGTISVKNSNTKQQGSVKNGVARISLNLIEEDFTNGQITLEFTPDSFFDEKPFTVPVTIPVVRKAAKGELLVHKNQQIYSGKEFTLYFQLFDSDKGVTPTIDIPSLSIASPNNNLYCQVTNYLNGYGFATCENIDTPGEHSLVLKYNGAVLHEKTIAVQENPYQYINEAIVLLLVILVIVSLLILCVGVVSFIIFYKKLNKGNGKNTPNRPQGRFIREEDAEELDNM